MIDKLSKIYDGWYNAIYKDTLHPDQKRVAQRRLESCSNCPYSQEHWAKVIIDRIKDAITGKEKKIRERRFSTFQCSICGCPISKKIYSFHDECPLPFHNHTTYPHPQRWGKISMNEDGSVIGSDNIYITS